MTKNMVRNMNSIFVVTKIETKKLVANDDVPRTPIAARYILVACRTKRKALDLIEQFYYADIEIINKINCSNISNVFIRDNAVLIRGYYRVNDKFTNKFLYEYRIEEIPFE